MKHAESNGETLGYDDIEVVYEGLTHIFKRGKIDRSITGPNFTRGVSRATFHEVNARKRSPRQRRLEAAGQASGLAVPARVLDLRQRRCGSRHRDRWALPGSRRCRRHAREPVGWHSDRWTCQLFRCSLIH